MAVFAAVTVFAGTGAYAFGATGSAVAGSFAGTGAYAFVATGSAVAGAFVETGAYLFATRCDAVLGISAAFVATGGAWIENDFFGPPPLPP